MDRLVLNNTTVEIVGQWGLIKLKKKKDCVENGWNFNVESSRVRERPWKSMLAVCLAVFNKKKDCRPNQMTTILEYQFAIEVYYYSSYNKRVSIWRRYLYCSSTSCPKHDEMIIKCLNAAKTRRFDKES